MSEEEYEKLFSCEYQGMLLDVLERNGERSFHSDRSIIHTRMKVDDPASLLLVYQQMMMASLALLPTTPARVLFLGLGGASQIAYLHKHYPEVKLDVIEYSEEIIDISKKYFFLPESTNVNVFHVDASHLERVANGSYDLIFLDLCDSDGPIMSFQEFPYLRKLRHYLLPKGWVTANTWSEPKELERELRDWMKAFSFVYTLENPRGGAVIFAGGQAVDVQKASVMSLPQDLALHLKKLYRP